MATTKTLTTQPVRPYFKGMSAASPEPIESILVDIDSTLYDSDPLFIKYLEQRHGIVLPHIERWDFWRDHISAEAFTALIKESYHSKEEILAAIPYPGAVEAITSWHRAGARIHVVSDRNPRRTGAHTRSWLAAIGLPYTELVMRSPIDKVAYAHAKGIGLVIDDKPDTLRQAVDSGLAAATILHIYNNEVLAERPEIISAPDWATLQHKVDRRLRVGRMRARRRSAVVAPA